MSNIGDYGIITSLNSMIYTNVSSFSPLGKMNVQKQHNVMSIRFDTNTILSYDDYSYTNTGISVDPNSACLALTSNSDTIQFQSKKRAYYESGRNVEIVFNAKLYDSQNINSVTKVGLYDNNNGIFIGYDGSINDVYIGIRSNTSGSPIDTIVPRTSFNRNTLIGYNFANIQQFKIDVLWNMLFRFSVISNGKIIIVHEQFFTNTSILPFVQSFCLPFRCECITTAGIQNLFLLNASVDIDGGYNLVKRSFNLNNPDFKNRTINSDGVPIIAIRINPTYNNSTIRIKSIEMTSYNTGGAQNVVCWFYGMIYYYDADNGLTINGGSTHTIQDSISEFVVEPDSVSYGPVPKQLVNKFMASGPNTNFSDTVEITVKDNEISSTLSGNSDYFVLFGKTNTDKTEVYYNVVVEEIY